MTKKLTVYDALTHKLESLDPKDATALPIPAFVYGTARPAVGAIVGQAFINTTTGTASVWDGTKWTNIARPVITHYPTENDLLQATPADGTVAMADDRGNIYSRISAQWLPLGIRIYGTMANLNADTPPNGTLGFAEDTGEFAVRAGNLWAALTNQGVTVGNTAPTTPAAGNQWLDTQNAVLWTYDGTDWQPPTGGNPVGTIITHASWNPPIGYLRCDGSQIPADRKYDALRTLIGTNAPDMREFFLRMSKDGTDMLTDAPDTTRKPRTDFTVHVGGVTGSNGNHHHNIKNTQFGDYGGGDGYGAISSMGHAHWGGANPQNNDTDDAGTHNHSVSIDGTVNGGDVETAPVHIKIAYHIKW